MSTTSSSLSDGQASVADPVFAHLEIYHRLYQAKFNKPSDPLILFYHYALIHNRFKNTSDAKKTDFLPDGWNTAKQYYDLLYAKHDFNYRLEVYIIGDFLQICLKRLSDSVDVLLDVRASDYVDPSAYKTEGLLETYRQLPQFYKRVQWSIDQVKHRRPKLPRSDSICSASSSLQSVIKCKQMLTAHSLTASPHTYQEIVAQIKQESFSALEVAAPEPAEETAAAAHQARSSLASVSSCSLKAKPPKKTCTKADLYVYNPITNYAGYNRHVDSQRSVDEDNQENDPWVRHMFAKFGLRGCQTRLHDVMRTDFSGMRAPVHLTEAMKLKYRLSTEAASKQPPQKTRRKTVGGRGGQQRRARRAKSPVERESSCEEVALPLLTNDDDDSNSAGLPDLDLRLAPAPTPLLNIASIFTNLKKKNTSVGKGKENAVVVEDSDSELDLDSRPAKRSKMNKSSPNEPLTRTPTMVKFLEMKKMMGQSPPHQEAALTTPSSGYKRPARTPFSSQKKPSDKKTSPRTCRELLGLEKDFFTKGVDRKLTYEGDEPAEDRPATPRTTPRKQLACPASVGRCTPSSISITPRAAGLRE